MMSISRNANISPRAVKQRLRGTISLVEGPHLLRSFLVDGGVPVRMGHVRVEAVVHENLGNDTRCEHGQGRLLNCVGYKQ